MRLSIVIPVYNAEKYIKDCLESIIKELKEDMEVILIDDGSKDDSYKIIKNYQKDNILVFHHENRGVSYTRNQGIEKAKGEYIMFVDIDDCLIEGWSNIVLEAISSQNDVFYFSEKIKQSEIKKIDVIDNIFGVKTNYEMGNISSPCSKIYKKNFLIKNMIKFNENLINGEDALFNLRVILNSQKFVCISQSFYKYRIYANSSTKKFNEKFFNSNLEFLSLIGQYLNVETLTTKEKERYISKSIIYSIYLYLVLISTLNDKERKKRALKCLYDENLKIYFNKYFYSKDCSIAINLIYFLVKKHFIKVAMYFIKIRNMLKVKKMKKINWEVL